MPDYPMSAEPVLPRTDMTFRIPQLDPNDPRIEKMKVSEGL